MKSGRGRGPLQSRKYNGRPPRDNKERNPALPRFTPVTLIKRGPVTTRSRRNFTCCSGVPGFGRGHGQRQNKYF